MCREKTEKLLKNYIISENNMESEKVKEIKEYLRCMRGEKACWACGLNEIAENQDTCCINLVADMALDLINELESENERLENENYKLEQNLGQCENGYKLELHTARYQLHSANEDLKKAEKKIADLEIELLRYKNLKIKVNKASIEQFAERLKEKFVRQEERFATDVTRFETDLNKVKEIDLLTAKYLIGKATGQATMAEKAQYYIDETLKECINE